MDSQIFSLVILVKEKLVSCRLAFADGDYVLITIAGASAILEYSVGGVSGKELLKKKIAFLKYYKLVEELIKKHGYVIEKV